MKPTANLKKQIEAEVSEIIRQIGTHCTVKGQLFRIVFIGNMMYTEVDNRPCFEYLRNAENPNFRPIYDPEYGWDWYDSQKLFDLIRNEASNKI